MKKHLLLIVSLIVSDAAVSSFLWKDWSMESTTPKQKTVHNCRIFMERLEYGFNHPKIENFSQLQNFYGKIGLWIQPPQNRKLYTAVEFLWKDWIIDSTTPKQKTVHNCRIFCFTLYSLHLQLSMVSLDQKFFKDIENV